VGRKDLILKAGALAILALLGGCQEAASRDQVRGVGSSTVYPFATAVAEQFVNRNPEYRSPIVESTGSGAGIKLFCAGVGAAYPDFVNSSRRMKRSEYDMCTANGVTQVVELKIGLDGIAFAESAQGLRLPLTRRLVYTALAERPFGRPQTARRWNQIDPRLPDAPIRVYGPPSTSGTRDALLELIMKPGCDTDLAMKALKERDEDAHEAICTTVREDGGFIDAGENDNLIVQKIEADPKAVGIFGYSFLAENRDFLHANTMDGVEPTYETISTFQYPGARPLYVYVKGDHVRAIRGLRAFVAEFANGWAENGYLRRRGMVVAPPEVRAQMEQVARTLTPLDAAALK
jgi:phosphate transport system substrate-binding protein